MMDLVSKRPLKSISYQTKWRMGSPTIVIEMIGIFWANKDLPMFLPMSVL
jgi:hypothetical protein